jgi:hypothetical protein
MDKYIYREILEMDLISTIHMHNLEEENIIFQHENDPKHSSKYVKQLLLAQEFQIIWHQPQPLDLDPIEQL